MDQAQWVATTAWGGDPPSLDHLWAVLTDPGLPPRVLDTVHDQATKQPLLKKLHAAQGALLNQRAELKGSNPRFLNLPSGRFTEKLFERRYRATLREFDLQLVDQTTDRNFIDFTIEQPGDFSLPINTKNAGILFRNAAKTVGLEPEDTLPVAAYKAFGSEADHPLLVYAFLVDWSLIEKLRDAYWDSLSPPERLAFQALAGVKGMSRVVEDSLIEATVAGRIGELARSVGYGDERAPNFRAISAAKVRSILYALRGRTPGVFQMRINTEPAVHVSVEGDTLHFDEFVETHLATPEARTNLVEALGATTTMEVPNPPV